MPVCIAPRASLESGFGDHAGKAITTFSGVCMQVAEVSMEGLYCGTNGGKMYFPLTQKWLRKQRYKEKGGLTETWESVQLQEQGSRLPVGMCQRLGEDPREGVEVGSFPRGVSGQAWAHYSVAGAFHLGLILCWLHCSLLRQIDSSCESWGKKGRDFQNSIFRMS